MPRWTVAWAVFFASVAPLAASVSALAPDQGDVSSSSAAEEPVSTFSSPPAAGDGGDERPVGLGVLAILAGIGLLAVGLRLHRRA